MELGLILALIRDPGDYGIASSLVERADFKHPETAAAFEALARLMTRGTNPDIQLVGVEAESILRSWDHDQASKESKDLVERLLSAPPPSDDVSAYSTHVRRLAELRRVEQVLRNGMSRLAMSADPSEIASEAMEGLHKASLFGHSQRTMHYSEILSEYRSKLREEAAMRSEGVTPGIMFGFSPIDDYTHGLRYDDGDFMILGGMPGSGKTSTMQYLMRKFAIEQKGLANPVGSLFLNLEMGTYATGMRFTQMTSQVTSRDLRRGLDPQVMARIEMDHRAEEDIPLWSVFAGDLYTDQIRAVVMSMVKKHNVRFVVLDHMRKIKLREKVRDDNERGEMRAQFIKNQLCKSLGITVVALAHTRKIDRDRPDQKPNMGDLRGSGQIAAEADMMAFVHRPYELLTDEEKNSENPPYSPDEAYIVWAKNRNDQMGDPPFIFQGRFMTISSAADYGEGPKVIEPAQASFDMGLDEW